MCSSCYRRYSLEKRDLKIFARFTGNPLRRSLFSLAGLLKKRLRFIFWCEFCQIFKFILQNISGEIWACSWRLFSPVAFFYKSLRLALSKVGDILLLKRRLKEHFKLVFCLRSSFRSLNVTVALILPVLVFKWLLISTKIDSLLFWQCTATSY